MQSLLIMAPMPVAAVVSQTIAGMSRALSPDPKEAFICPANTGVGIILDMGVAVTVDTAFVGYHTAIGTQQFSMSACDSAGSNALAVVSGTSLAPLGYGPPNHGFRKGTARTSRYFRFDFSSLNAAAFSVGVIALGKAWQSQWGQEMGAGRQVIDTGSAERLFGGGFGIDEGARSDAYQWTFGDLQAAEIRSLYAIVSDRGTTRTVLVIEDPEITDGLNERIHWGLFQKLDFYERVDPSNWKWSLQVADWA